MYNRVTINNLSIAWEYFWLFKLRFWNNSILNGNIGNQIVFLISYVIYTAKNSYSYNNWYSYRESPSWHKWYCFAVEFITDMWITIIIKSAKASSYLAPRRTHMLLKITSTYCTIWVIITPESIVSWWNSLALSIPTILRRAITVLFAITPIRVITFCLIYTTSWRTFQSSNIAIHWSAIPIVSTCCIIICYVLWSSNLGLNH